MVNAFMLYGNRLCGVIQAFSMVNAFMLYGNRLCGVIQAFSVVNAFMLYGNRLCGVIQAFSVVNAFMLYGNRLCGVIQAFSVVNAFMLYVAIRNRRTSLAASRSANLKPEGLFQYSWLLLSHFRVFRTHANEMNFSF